MCYCIRCKQPQVCRYVFRYWMIFMKVATKKTNYLVFAVNVKINKLWHDFYFILWFVVVILIFIQF